MQSSYVWGGGLFEYPFFFSKVPVDTDFQEIVKEISIMQQCDSPYVVKYYGSYFKHTDLWVSAEIICLSIG